MWQYNKTKNLYPRIITNNSMMHSETYLGTDFSDGIKHWKYLRKYKKNGHTYYVYDETEEKLNKAAADVALKTANYIGETGYVNSKGQYVKTKIDNNMLTSSSRILGTKNKQSLIEKANEDIFNKAVERITKYKVEQIKNIPKKIISKGVAKVSSILKKLRKD